jgi:hypothetical protein
MEAMRLSLVEHEEQQRREAANKEQSSSSEPDTARAPGDTAMPTALSSSAAQSTAISEPRSGSHTPTPTPSALSPSPAPSFEQSSTVAQGRPSSSTESTFTGHRPVTPTTGSRKRTPSPPNPHSSGNLQIPSQSSGWGRRSPSPHSFSTIAAAISATSTATAFLQGDEASTRGDNAAGMSGSPSTPAATSNPPPANSPPSAVSSNPPATAGIPPTPFYDSGHAAVKPVRPPVSTQTESYSSSIFSTESTSQHPESPYDVLGSSPDSEFSREPLLGNSEPNTPTIPATGLQELMPSQVGEGAAK